MPSAKSPDLRVRLGGGVEINVEGDCMGITKLDLGLL